MSRKKEDMDENVLDMISDSVILSVEEVAKIFRVSVPTVHRWVREGRVYPALRTGAGRGYTKSWVARLLVQGLMPAGTYPYQPSARAQNASLRWKRAK